jgi:nitrite reductase (NO-forming)
MSQTVLDAPGTIPAPADDPRRAEPRPSSWALVGLLFGGMVLFFGLLTGFVLLVEHNGGKAAPAASTAGAATRDVDVTLTEFSIKPAAVSVAAGTTVTFHVTNNGSIAHNLTLATGQATPTIPPGGSADLKAGPFTSSTQAFCSIPGHKQAGMVMAINVTGGSGSAAPAAMPGMTPSSSPDAKIDFSAMPGPAWRPFDPTLAPAPGATVHDVTFHITETTREVAPGVSQQVWAFNGQVPGPILRGHIGDVFNVTLVNDGTMGHSIDFHASQVAPNVAMRTIQPGQSLVYQFKAAYAGIWMYHCGTAPAIEHIANGMFGAVVIDPPGLAPVAHEFVMVQSELYLGPSGQPGDMSKMLADKPDAVVFNGYANQYKYAPIKVDPGQRIRIWVLDAGPNDISSFHIVGTIFDTVYKEGHYELQPGPGGSQALDLLPAQGGFVETTFAQPGVYTMVSHRFADASQGDLGTFDVGGATGTMNH